MKDVFWVGSFLYQISNSRMKHSSAYGHINVLSAIDAASQKEWVRMSWWREEVREGYGNVKMTVVAPYVLQIMKHMETRRNKLY